MYCCKTPVIKDQKNTHCKKKKKNASYDSEMEARLKKLDSIQERQITYNLEWESKTALFIYNNFF